jgi:hypothetical protein
VTGILGVLQGEISLKGAEASVKLSDVLVQESKLSMRLTFVGLIFFLLAYCTSPFSMGDTYQPGASRFWIYFAVAIPVAIFTILGFILLRLPSLDKWLSRMTQEPRARVSSSCGSKA